MVLARIPNYGEDPKVPFRTFTPLGLPIFPVRQAVIPEGMAASIPAPLVNSDLPTLAQHRYALRSLREGFLYVQYEQHPRDAELKWHIYQVNEEGQVGIINHEAMVQDKDGNTKQPEGTLVEEPVPTPCPNAVYIEKPLQQQRVWLAFSDTLWSQETLDRMVANAEDRDKRMHCFEPKPWITDKAYKGAVEATSKEIGKVLEYSKRSHYANLQGEYVGEISETNGTFNEKHLAQCTSIDRLHLDTSIYKILEQGITGNDLLFYGKSYAMEEALKRIPNSENMPAAMIALDDSAGIAYELNGFCNEPAGYLDQYHQERELELHAMRAIEGAKDLMKNHAVRKLHLEGMGHQMTPEAFEYIGGLEENPVYKNAEVIPFTDENGVEKLHIIEERYITSWRNRHAESELHAWDDYEDDVDEGALNTFKQNYAHIKKETERLMNERAEDLATWLRATPFIDSLLEYDKTNLNDGNHCVDVIGCAINGITATTAGQTLVDNWVESKQVTDENLLWRAIGLNHEETTADLQSVLNALGQDHYGGGIATAMLVVTQVQNALDNIAKASIKSMQLHALNKKSRGVAAARGGLEKLFTTVNQRMIKPFVAPGTNAATGLIVQATLMARSGIKWLSLKQYITEGLEEIQTSHQQQKDKLTAKFHDEEWKRYQKEKHIKGKKEEIKKLDKLIKELDFNNSDTSQRERQTLQNTWFKDLEAEQKELKQRHKKMLSELDGKGKINDMAFVRFNTLLLIFQGAAINSLLNELDDATDPEKAKQLQQALVIMGVSTAATLSDTIGTLSDMYKAPGSKAIFATSVKVVGAKFAVVAGVMATVMDFNQMRQYFRRGENTISAVYGLKVMLNGASALGSGISFVGMANPLLKRSGIGVLRTIGGRAAAMIAAHAFLMACLWIGLGILVVEVLIVVLKENELEDWLERSAFGPVHKRTIHSKHHYVEKGAPVFPRYKTLEEQQAAFKQAIMAVLSKV